MEEIITVDGKQYKLTYDKPLTVEQRTQTIESVRKQTGCGTCGGQRMINVGGIIKSMATTCTKTTIQTAPNNIANLAAAPTTGTALYHVRFLGQFGGAPALLAGGGLTGSADQTGIAESPDGIITTTTVVSYAVSDAELVASAGGPPAATNVDGTGIDVPAGAANSVRFLVSMTDSCPGTPKKCLEYCDIAITCPTPTCNFVVT